jgi:hypothetical protein
MTHPLPQKFTHVVADPLRADACGGFRQGRANDQEDVWVKVVESATEVPRLGEREAPEPGQTLRAGSRLLALAGEAPSSETAGRPARLAHCRDTQTLAG